MDKPIEFDLDKNAQNISKHGVSLAVAGELDWGAMLVREDKRFDYKEARFVGLAPLGDRLYCVVYTYRLSRVRIISLRKANAREVGFYNEHS